MKKIPVILLLAFFAMPAIYGQIKIGDNPQAISPTSVLELESNDRVLVITRINTAQMNAIVPNQGAMVYNTDTQCIHYYDGAQWVNLCSGGFEIPENSISTEHIINGGINGVDIQNGSIGPGKLQDQSVTQEKLGENSVGAFALDNDNINLSDFTNDQGFITIADVISAAAGNDIIDNGGAFYDDQTLQDDIAANTAFINAHITADADTNINNEIQTLSFNAGANQLTLTNPSGDNIITLPGGGNPTDELQDLNFNTGTNILTLTNPATAGNQVDLSSLAGGGADGSETIINTTPTVTVAGTGTALDPYLLTSIGGADGSETIINDSPTVTVAGTGTTLDPYVLTSSGGADGSETIIDATASTIGVTGTGTTLDPYVLTATAGDGSETIIDATASTIGVTGTGTTLDPYVLTATAGDGSETIIDATASTVGVTGTGTTLDPYVLTATAGDGSETIIDATASTVGVTGTGTTLDPYVLTSAAADVTFSPAGNTISTDVQNAIEELQTDIDGLAAGGEPNTSSNQGVGGVELVLPKNVFDLPFKSINAADSGLLTITDDTANNEIDIDITPAAPLTPAANQMLITNGTTDIVEWAPLAAHLGTAKNIFFAAADGTPTTTDDNANGNDDGGLIWDTDARPVGALTYGALIVGQQAGSPALGTHSKVVITERIVNTHPTQFGLAFPLQLQNESGNIGSSSGIMFAVEPAGDFGKGALVFERTGAWGVGDFHFLQNTQGNNSIPVITEKAFTIRNNSDIVLYGGIDIDGIGTGGANQVLTADGAGGITWAAGGGGGTDNQQLTLATNLLTLEDGGTPIDLTPYLDDQTAGEVTVAATPTNYGAATADVEAHLAGINTALATGSTDDQQLTLATNLLTLEDGGTPIDLTPYLDDQTAGEVTVAATPTNYTAATADVEAHLAGINTALASGGQNLSTDNLTQDTEPRTYDMSGQTLSFFNGKIGVGSGTLDSDPAVILHVLGNGQARAGSFKAGNGTAGLPSYRFTANNDTGMFLVDPTGVLGFSANDVEAMRIDASQNVGIGFTTPSQKLDVNGNIRASGNFISAATTLMVPDYVFEKYFIGTSNLNDNYRFKSLEEIESFIKANKHLPGIMSAKKVKESGEWNLSKSNLQNLEKIEELFLHTIEQEKKIKALQSEKDTLTDELDAIKKDLEEIKALLKKSN